ncbi:MAG: hypothetical protein PSV35_06390 [bacterium]|nr:hypothetical protein [bacterium]
MLKYVTTIGLILIAEVSIAKPCFMDQRSCMELKNNTPSSVQIDCNGYEEITAAGYSKDSTQLDLGSNDGMGSPSPWTLQCTLISGQIKRSFTFYNPYWGPLIEFNLLSEDHLKLRINNRWGSNETFYTFTW